MRPAVAHVLQTVTERKVLKTTVQPDPLPKLW